MSAPSRVALRRLDALLAHAVLAAESGRPELPVERLRGLYIDREEVERLLCAEPGAPLLAAPEPDAAVMDQLASRLKLEPFDVDALLLAMAPQLDLRYERLFGYLHDDVTRRAASVDLALNLLCGSAEQKLSSRVRFQPGAPLIDHGLVLCLSPSDGGGRSFLASELVADELAVRHVCGLPGLDARLDGVARIESAPAAPRGEVRAMRRLVTSGSAQVWAYGHRNAGARRVAAGLAQALQFELLTLELEGRGDPVRTLALAALESLMRNAVLLVEGLETLPEEEGLNVGRRLAAHLGPLVVAGEDSSPPPGLTGSGLVPAPVGDLAQDRLGIWRDELELAGADGTDLGPLVDRFRLTHAEVRDAVDGARAQARHRAAWTGGGPARPTLDELFAAARESSAGRVGNLAQRLRPSCTFDRLVVPPRVERQLRAICRRVALRRVVLEEWGFEERLVRGLGVSALFAGASGTGKTMAAEVIAHELGLDLFKVNLAGVVSKYIGETEKNLARVFDTARGADGILFFDEAEALFGKRSAVRDSHDRYANIEISYLLQRMEDHEGVAILATNLRENLDDAFLRRLAFTVQFPFPDAVGRLRIWQGVWPEATPLADDVELEELAESLKLSGGSIRNAAVTAAFAAAGDGAPIGMDHLRAAAAEELRKLGLLETTAIGTSFEQDTLAVIA